MTSDLHDGNLAPACSPCHGAFPDIPALPEFLGLWEQAERRLAGLEARLAALPAGSPVRTGWQERMLLTESVACAALEGAYLDPDRLALWDVDADPTPPEPALTVALGGLYARRALARTRPVSLPEPVCSGENTSLATVESVLALHRRCLRGNGKGEAETPSCAATPDESSRIRQWLAWETGLAAPFPALPAAALALAGWHDRVGLRHGGTTGRCLISVRLWQRGVVSGPWFPLASGFAGEALSGYRLHRHPFSRWFPAFLQAIVHGCVRAERELQALLLLEERLARLCQNRRRHSRLRQVGDLLLGSPAVSSGRVATTLAMSRRGAILRLEELTAGGFAEEVSGRERFRVYRTARRMTGRSERFFSPSTGLVA